jgi:hypothetical protein
MLAVRNPLVDIARKILKDSRSWFTVLVLRLEMCTLLGPSCEGRGHSLLTGPISGDNADATIPFAALLRPYPPTETCWVPSRCRHSECSLPATNLRRTTPLCL